MTLQNIEETVAALRIRVETLEGKFKNLVSSINDNEVSKKQLDSVKAEIIQLKDALERGDFTSSTGVQTSALETLDEVVGLAAQTQSLLEEVRKEVTSVSDTNTTQDTKISQLQAQIAALTIKIDQHLLV